MVENLIRDMRRDAKAGHAGNSCPPQVVQSPPFNFAKLVKFSFGVGKYLEVTTSGAFEYVAIGINVPK